MDGCTPPEPLGPRKAVDWAYTPTSISVHPLSRFRNPRAEDEKSTIVVHVEFLDGDEFACRGVGKLRINIITIQNELIAFKLVDLENPDDNRNSFDNVTRTYLVLFDSLEGNFNRVNIEAIFHAESTDPYRSELFTIVNHANE